MKTAALLLALTASVPAAQAQAPGVTLAGYGAIQCQNLALGRMSGDNFRATQTGLGVVAWAQGYLSGLNAIEINAGRRTIDLSGGRAPELWSTINSECRDNPQKKIEDVVAEFFLHNRR